MTAGTAVLATGVRAVDAERRHRGESPRRVDHLGAGRHLPHACPLDAAVGILERVVELENDTARRAFITG